MAQVSRTIDAPCDGGDATIDLRGLRCPLPVLKIGKALRGSEDGATLVALSDDPLAGADIPNFLRESGDELVASEREGAAMRFVIRRRVRPQE